MIAQERADFFREVEKEFPVDKWIVGDAEVWPLIKFEINKILKAKNETFSEIERKSNKIAFSDLIQEGISLIKFPFYYFIDRQKNQKVGKKAEIVFLTQSTRRSFLNNKYFDRICDPYIEVLNKMEKDYISIEWTYDHKYKVPRTFSSKLIQPALDFLGLKSILFKKKHIDIDKLQNFIDFLNFLNKCEIDHQDLLKTLSSSINLMFIYAKFFERKLAKIKPKYAFIFPFFGIVGSAFILACSRLGITSIDIQHGFYHMNEPLYYGLQKIPKNGYKLLPNIFWCWDKKNKTGIENWNQNVSDIHKAFVGGNLWINRWKKSDKNSFNSIKIDHCYYNLDNPKTKLLITFSPFYLIPEWLPKAVKETEENCIYSIRFHHNTPKDVLITMKRQFENCGNVEFKYANELPLPVVLMNTDIHITIESSCLIEAKALGVPTILISSRGETVYFKEIEEEWAVKGYDELDFYKAIDRLKEFNGVVDKKKVSNRDILESFFNSN